MTTRWKLTVEYEGSSFSGWQKQMNAPSVQEAIERAIHAFSGETVDLFVAGRTDAGVHALGQVAHFDLEKPMEPHAICGAVNFHVRPQPVVVLKAEMVADDFHARFNALSRSYRYLISNREAPLALMAGRAWHVPQSLDVEGMQKAAALLIGHHDFSTFRASGCQANSSMRTLDRLDIRRDGEMIVFDTQAKSFLYHQVRNMVGTLAMVGRGAWTLQDFAKAFAASDRMMGGPTAPSEGLYFLNVEYP